MKRLLAVAALVAAGILVNAAAALAFNGDTLVSTGSPPSPFSQNKQNEPSITHDPVNPDVLVAGANEEIDMEACNAGADNTCPFTHGVGSSGVYFSFDGGDTWSQPQYTGISARNCLGVPGDDAGCTTESEGPIGTLPWYGENGLVSDGDPALAFGPVPDASGHFSWSNGSRLYYANLTANVGSTRTDQTFRGFEAIGVSRTDDVSTAATGGDAGKAAWMPPVLVSRQSSTTFSDKDQVWADNAASSPHFGTVYVCWAAFQGQELGNGAPSQLQVAVSHDGGDRWSQHPIGSAAGNARQAPPDGCTIRTDSRGNAYVFGVGTANKGGRLTELMSKSTDGGSTWSAPRAVTPPVEQPGILDPEQGRPTIDGLNGARSDLAIAPSVDIANGAPTGEAATDRIVMTYVSGPLDQQDVLFTESTSGGSHWSAPRAIETAGDYGLFTAPAISPSGGDVYVVYNAFTTPYRDNTTDPRSVVGVVLHADSSADPGTPTGAFSELGRGVAGDPRGSSANALTDEFLGDYVYATATDQYGAAVWNDARNAADCPAIDSYRFSLDPGQTATDAPAPEQDCAASFGDSDIFGGSFADPTP
ncbi:MAG TPA: sialidase family protein [Solirubrobacteraceae bacterium]|nr:sialidase family protein [Solirubrobacteraceae bacterium]